MEAGRLRHRITFQQATETYNDVGEPVTTWSDFKTVWAEVRPLKGEEYWSSQQVNAQITHRVNIRYLPGIDSTMRIKFKERYFDIEPPLNADERNVRLSMYCKEVV